MPKSFSKDVGQFIDDRLSNMLHEGNVMRNNEKFDFHSDLWWRIWQTSRIDPERAVYCCSDLSNPCVA